MFDLHVNAREVERGLSDFARKQLPFALAVALNATVREVREAVRAMLIARLDSPSRWTLNSMGLRFATKAKPAAAVYFLEHIGSGIAGGKYLDHMETGGPRGRTRFELLLQYAAGILPGFYVTLAEDRPNARGIATQVISQLRTLREGSATDSARSRRSRKRSGSVFIVKEPQRIGSGPGLPLGIWRRRGLFLEPLFWIVRGAPRYAKRITFQETARRTAEDRFPENLAAAFARAIASARR